VYLPGYSVDQDLAGGVTQVPAPGLALVSRKNNIPGRVTPLDVSVSYATFAADGVQRRPHFVTTVTSAEGALLHETAADPEPVVAADVARQFTARLKENPACGGVACVPDVAPWMIGYTPRLAVTVYVKKADAGDVDAGLPRRIWQEFSAEIAR
jgi:membrane peptidoglycan carboxypeptidase